MIALLVIFIPIVFGIILPFLRLNKSFKNVYSILVAVITSCVICYVVVNDIAIDVTCIRLNEILTIGFKIDGLSKLFLMMIAVLWPLATLYATEYMEHEENQDSFFRYYLIAYGITIGIATSRNIISLYLFYELLTFLTLPLIIHKGDKSSNLAGKIYLILSILGASIALIGIIIFTSVVPSIEFINIGQVNELINKVIIDGHTNIFNRLYISYILMFLGFGVKAAIVPFSIWLPLCSVAPTPVSALLHAVAVVKSGVFAIIRVTYSLFGIAFLSGSVVQKIAISLTIVTILYGSLMAVRDKHIKRRLAYSTVSNLSYILFATMLMTTDGLSAGLTHMVFHAIIKINLFFAAGSIMIYSKKEYVDEVSGLAKKMPMTMLNFLISAFALIGVPLTCGFISKYALITSAINNKSYFAYVGIGAIVISSILTLIYLFEIVVPAYFTNHNYNVDAIKDVKEAGIRIKVTMLIITALIIYFGINSNYITNFIESVVIGL